MKSLEALTAYLGRYDGKPLRVMEVCGTHTAAIFKGGIRNLLSPKIRLVSGPGCPVCLASEAYIDRLYSLALEKNSIVASFGDLFKVKGALGSLSDAKAAGGHAAMVYSPLEVLQIAKNNPEKTVVMAAEGFETTAPLYALLLRSAMDQGIGNIRLLTALKRLIPALLTLSDTDIDGFIAPGHVAAIIGSDAFVPLSQTFRKPFAATGFTTENILTALYYLVRQIEEGAYSAVNLYGEVVRKKGNEKALWAIEAVFEPGPAYWRGMTEINDSGYYLKEEYAIFDAGSHGLNDSDSNASACRCGSVLTGKIDPVGCPLFGNVCTPNSAYGPCMVSAEGACGIWYREGQVC